MLIILEDRIIAAVLLHHGWLVLLRQRRRIVLQSIVDDIAALALILVRFDHICALSWLDVGPSLLVAQMVARRLILDTLLCLQARLIAAALPRVVESFRPSSGHEPLSLILEGLTDVNDAGKRTLLRLLLSFGSKFAL